MIHTLNMVWNPSEGIDLGFFLLRFYSLSWVLAFGLGWYVMKPIFMRENESVDSLDKLFLYTLVATMLGARLGHVIFYEPELFSNDAWSILLPIKTEPTLHFTGFAGLASHGAAIGMITSMYIYNKKILKKSVLWILDRVVIASALGAIFIRIGNFFNSEMIGKPTEEGFPLAIIFRQLDSVPRHPGQLYEAFGYIFVFITLFLLYWKTKKSTQSGFLFGLFLVLLMSVRVFVEQFKIAQIDSREDWILGLNTGQVLSIPFVVCGLYFMFFFKPKTN